MVKNETKVTIDRIAFKAIENTAHLLYKATACASRATGHSFYWRPDALADTISAARDIAEAQDRLYVPTLLDVARVYRNKQDFSDFTTYVLERI